MQRFLSEAAWDEDAVLGDVRDWVAGHLGEPGAVLVIDETGDVKKGTATVGCSQSTGTAGRVENAQVGVCLTYATTKGHALMDRALYLPRSCTGDPGRLAAAGVPRDVGFATRPAGDEVYGADSKLRKALNEPGIGYVLAIVKTHQIKTGIGARRAIDLAVRLPGRSWQRLFAGRGAKGERWYDWALADAAGPAVGDGGQHWLLMKHLIVVEEEAVTDGLLSDLALRS